MTTSSLWDQLYQSQFAFPTGGVWGNVFATPVLAVLAWFGWGRIKAWLAKHHSKLVQEAESRVHQWYREADEHLFADKLPDWGQEGAPDGQAVDGDQAVP